MWLGFWTSGISWYNDFNLSFPIAYFMPFCILTVLSMPLTWRVQTDCLGSRHFLFRVHLLQSCHLWACLPFRDLSGCLALTCSRCSALESCAIYGTIRWALPAIAVSRECFTQGASPRALKAWQCCVDSAEAPGTLFYGHHRVERPDLKAAKGENLLFPLEALEAQQRQPHETALACRRCPSTLQGNFLPSAHSPASGGHAHYLPVEGPWVYMGTRSSWVVLKPGGSPPPGHCWGGP